MTDFIIVFVCAAFLIGGAFGIVVGGIASGGRKLDLENEVLELRRRLVPREGENTNDDK